MVKVSHQKKINSKIKLHWQVGTSEKHQKWLKRLKECCLDCLMAQRPDGRLTNPRWVFSWGSNIFVSIICTLLHSLKYFKTWIMTRLSERFGWVTGICLWKKPEKLLLFRCRKWDHGRVQAFHHDETLLDSYGPEDFRCVPALVVRARVEIRVSFAHFPSTNVIVNHYRLHMWPCTSAKTHKQTKSDSASSTDHGQMGLADIPVEYIGPAPFVQSE